jgi:hypothetical protein
MNRLGLILFVALAAAIAGQAMAQAQHKPPSFVTPPPQLRGPQAPAQQGPPPAPVRPPNQSLDPTLAPPVDTAARLGGLEQERAGGAICRQACAQTYYFCLTTEESQSCAASWTTCLTACPSNSSRE